MYAYCVREFSKKTFMPKQNYFNVSVNQRTRKPNTKRKTRFLALLRRLRFSKRSFNERLQTDSQRPGVC